MKVRVLWFGRPTAGPLESEVAAYRQRVSRRWAAEDVRLRPASGGRAADPRRALRLEAESVRRHVPQGWTVVVLDERGEELDSEGFAEMMRRLEEGGAPGATLVLGSDLGVDRELARSADRRLALGRLTLPHHLARLVLWEQLYRATDILGGGGYHRRDIQYGQDGGSIR